jgi:Dual OB-containing domain
MSAPRICVAGINVDTFQHVRPTTPPTDLITRRLLREEGGPFGVGAVVDLGPVRHQPAAPQTEDHQFQTHRARRVEDLNGDEFLAVLDAASSTSLEDGFGAELERVGWRYAVDVGKGSRSLVVLRARRRPVLEIDDRYGRLQLRFDDPDPRTYLSVTDARFFEPDHATIRRNTVADVARRLRAGVDVYLMLGLARPYQASKDDRERHWLQLNGLCLVDLPVGDQP